MTKDEKRRLEELERKVKELEARPPQIAYPYYVPYPVYTPTLVPQPYYPTYPYRIWSTYPGGYGTSGYATGTLAQLHTQNSAYTQ